MDNLSITELESLSINDLLRISFQKRNFIDRLNAITLLGSKKDSRVLPALAKITGDKDIDLEVRFQAVDSIGRLGDLRGIDTLIMILKDDSEDSPPQLRALSSRTLFNLDLKRGIEIGLDFLVNTRNENYLIYNAILDQLIYYYSLLKPQTTGKIKNVLEELLDRTEFKDSWDLGITLTKTLTLYNSLNGLKYLLYQKKKILENYKEDYRYFIESIDNTLEDLKSHNSLSKSSSDTDLYNIIKERNP